MDTTLIPMALNYLFFSQLTSYSNPSPTPPSYSNHSLTPSYYSSHSLTPSYSNHSPTPSSYSNHSLTPPSYSSHSLLKREILNACCSVVYCVFGHTRFIGPYTSSSLRNLDSDVSKFYKLNYAREM